MHTAWQVWRIAFYLEWRQWRNSFVRALRSPVGLLGAIVVFVIILGVIWLYVRFQMSGGDAQALRTLWLELSSEERGWIALLCVMLVSAFHLVFVLARRAFAPYSFVRGFSESDLHFLFASPPNAWLLMRALITIRTTINLGIGIPLYLILAVLLSLRFTSALVEDYLAHLASGAWLLVGYWAIRYMQGLFFELFGFYWAARLRRRPWLRWVLAAAGSFWLLSLIASGVMGFLAARARGVAPVQTMEYTLNGLPTLALSLPARATADALLAPIRGWTPLMGAAIVLWGAGCLWLARRLKRDSREIVDLVATGLQLGADSADEMPHAVRRQLERAMQANQGVRTPAMLERWRLQGIYALLWRDYLLSLRTTPVWITLLSLLGYFLMAGGMMLGAKYLFERSPNPRVVVFLAGAIPLLYLSSATSAHRHVNAHYDWVRALPFSAERYIRYWVFASTGAFIAMLVLPVYIAGLLVYPEVWHLWLGSLALMASYGWSGVLVQLFGQLQTAQPYLEAVESDLGVLWGLGGAALLLLGLAVYAAALEAGAWFPLIALGIALACLPVQRALMQQATEQWRDYTPFS
ncbi:MAG: hypothetical protein WHS44_03180 [Fimbriimonadales bacterium]|nr:MAG: hypothetical protein KatS3mg018_1901 [Fimbriimonadales bacterium]